MFRAKKRNFSLRDSPVKLGQVSSPSRPNPLTTNSNSPAKRLRLSEPAPVLSSTLLQESINTSANDISRVESPKVEIIKRTLFGAEKAIIHQEVVATDVSVQTPPPTPEVKSLCQLDILSKRKEKLITEDKELDADIENRREQIFQCAVELASLRAPKIRYEDYQSIVLSSINRVRDQFNSIYNPGQMLAGKLESTIRTIHERHMNKFGRMELEWNSYLDSSKSAIQKKIEDLTHEIELHRRTLETRQHLNARAKANNSFSNASRNSSVNSIAEKNVENTDNSGIKEETAGSPESTGLESKDPVNLDDDIQGEHHSDCIILDASDDLNVEREEIIQEQSIQSLEHSESKTEILDCEDTDVDEDQGDQERSFTQCQAQRVD